MANEHSPAEKPLGVRWERTVIEEVLLANVREQRRSRRWANVFRIFVAAYLLIFLLAYLGAQDWGSTGLGDQYSAVVDLDGVIASDAAANAVDVNENLRAAFEDKNAKGVILRVNSPGGSPVQSGLINDEIYRLRKKYPDKPFYVVIEDIGASGAYYVAVAGQEIYADKASIVGSIGVIMDNFGFVDAMDKLGVERRLITSGEHKALMDPFSPDDPVAKAHLQSTLDGIHRQFIEVVKKGRGERLSDDPALFSGLVWDGEAALKKGLIDGLGSVDYVARELIEAEDLVYFKTDPDVLEQLRDELGTSFGQALAKALAEVTSEAGHPRLH